MISSKEAIAISELAVYTPLFCASLFVNIRQGFSFRTGWYFLVVFCAIRIAGSAFEVVSAKNPTNVGDAIGAAILGSIGLSPLLLICLGLLHRVTDGIELQSWRTRAIRFLHLPCLIGLILGIVGGTEINSVGVQSSSGHGLTQGAGILFLVAFLGVLAMVAESALHFGRLANAETKVLTALLAAMPLLAVRMVYLMLVDFANSQTFSITHGSAYAQLGMAAIEEFIIIVIFVVVGTIVPRDAKRSSAGERVHPAGKGSVESQRWQSNV